MGRTVKVRYRLEFSGAIYSPQCWKGRASTARLAAHMEAFIASTLPGGANQHFRALPLPGVARIVRQSDGVIVARWAPGCVHRATTQTRLVNANVVFTECTDCGKTLSTD